MKASIGYDESLDANLREGVAAIAQVRGQKPHCETMFYTSDLPICLLEVSGR